MYAGNTSGQISVINIEKFEISHDVQAHGGVIRALAAHPTLPYLAGFANDRCLSIWRRGSEGQLEPVCTTSFRDIPCENDDGVIAPIFSHSVALWFHDTERRLVTRTGNGGIMEIEFDDLGAVNVTWSVRLHGDWDVQMVRYAKGTDMVMSAGRDGCLVLSDRGQELRRWKLGNTTTHWAEHVTGNEYLVASDCGRVAHVDISSDAEANWGNRFAYDDMEFITLNRVSKRAFATSFDRNVYEIDLHTRNSKGVVYKPGYKCIWAKSLEREPSTLLVQSRNGGLYKANVDTGHTLGVIKESPEALWTAINLPGGDLLAAGEGNKITRLHLASVDPVSRTSIFEISKIPLDIDSDTYTKRMVRQESTGLVVLGRTNGDILVGAESSFRLLLNVQSAVRDIVVSPDEPYVFCVTEDGRLLKIDLDSGEILLTHRPAGKEFHFPLWALAYNPVRELIAFADFATGLYIVSAKDFSTVHELYCERVKRIRWVSSDVMMFGCGEEVHRYTLGAETSERVVSGMQNTVEDFIWDARYQYLVLICYQCTLALFDYETGQRLDLIRDQMDYSKGIAWLDSSTDSRLYPWDFVTWGRSGAVHRFRIHDEQIVAVGPLGQL